MLTVVFFGGRENIRTPMKLKCGYAIVVRASKRDGTCMSPWCPDTSAALPMCLTDSSAVQPKCLVVCMCNVLSSVDGRYAYVCLPCTFS